mmetsp:Transcript_52103/g.127215  ORF Transcript_52103/g.127215 Transcript_52103/m.127215 type:complete len:265 (+) Transcript_52103:264-1058(+)
MFLRVTSSMCARSSLGITLPSPKKQSDLLSRDAPVVSGSTPSRSSRRVAEWLCTLQNHVGSPVSGCLMTGRWGGAWAWITRLPSTLFQNISTSKSTFMSTTAPRTAFITGSTAPWRGPSESMKPMGSSALEKRICLSNQRLRTSGLMSLSMRLPSVSRNSPPFSAALKHTKAARRTVRLPTISLCMPTKNFAREGLFTASYTAALPLTTGRPATECSGSRHASMPIDFHMPSKPWGSLVESNPRSTTAPWCSTFSSSISLLAVK